jgi:hypothetical protein
MKQRLIVMALVATCAACERQESAPNGNEAVEAANISTATVAAPDAIQPGQPGGLPDDHNLVAEGPIDPESAQGADQVLQSYGALLEQGRFAEARRLWVDGGGASGLSEEGFAEAFGKYAEIHAEIGAPGRLEGAAGSSYVEIPLRLYGRRKGDRPFSSVGTATLRRANDVPGSTDEQSRWHIYRVNLQPTP